MVRFLRNQRLKNLRTTRKFLVSEIVGSYTCLANAAGKNADITQMSYCPISTREIIRYGSGGMQ